MRSHLFLACLLVAGSFSGLLLANEREQLSNIDEKATHDQTALIQVQGVSSVNAFCLSKEGKIYAACGEAPGEVHVLDADGKSLGKWSVPVKPEAINVAPDGTILVAGQGKVLRLSVDGELLQQVDSPHAVALRESRDKLREQAKASLRQSVASVASRLETYQTMLDQIKKKEDKGELNAQEKQVLKVLPTLVEQLKKQQAQEGKQPEPKVNDEAIERQVNALSQSKSRISSISADEKHVYLATPSLVGYTFEVWRLDPDFTNSKVIVSDLRGCCGQMDVQACGSGLFVAENARHRVASFKADGEPLTAWGKRDITGADGFTSCCNPMNVCFNGEGDVFTAESNTGRIKRFAADGTFKEFVGDVKLVPGCKNVSIAVSSDGDRVYMLDITRKHIVLMKRKAASQAAGG